MSKKPNKKDTSWEQVAEWYDELLEEGSDTYQEKVILSNLLRLTDAKKGEKILDLACGQGYFTRAFAKLGAEVTGVDLSKTLIDRAKKASPEIPFFVSAGENLEQFEDKMFNKIICVLALQNMANIDKVFAECARVLKPTGRLLFVLNHPAFRIPQKSSWEFDAKKQRQYRRVDEYMSEGKTKIDMMPGSKSDKTFTVSFHRPLQVYSKFLQKNGFVIARIEEWISHKTSQKGPRQKAEDKARKEIPLFMCVEVTKLH